jgi:hypothetical protein
MNKFAVYQPVPRALYEDDELLWALVYAVWDAKLQLFNGEQGTGPLYVRTISYSYFKGDKEYVTTEDGPWTIADVLITGPAFPAATDAVGARSGLAPR